MTITRRFQILSAGVALASYAGVLFLADFAFGVGPLINPVSVTALMLRVGSVVYIIVSPHAFRPLRMLFAALVVAISGIPWAALVDDFGFTAEASAVLMLPWWLAFLLTTVWFEINGRTSARPSPLVLLPVILLLLGFLALVYVATVFWAE